RLIDIMTTATLNWFYATSSYSKAIVSQCANSIYMYSSFITTFLDLVGTSLFMNKPLTITQAVGPNEEGDIENENGGAGKHYILANDEWKEDILPEILDGHNFSCFYYCSSGNILLIMLSHRRFKEPC
ncbi:hypothetical protein ACJX0J_028420, partial [Zea mays]